MSNLDPELKRLMKMAGKPLDAPVVAPPYGFAGKVVARWQSESSHDALSIWFRIAAVSAKASAVLIVSGALFFAAQFHHEGNAYDITTIYKLSASSFAP